MSFIIPKVLNKQYNDYKYRATSKKIEFKILPLTFLAIASDPCYICGKKEDNVEKFNGVDRIDNTRGYVSCNMAACCWNCNRAKNDMSLVDFRNWMASLGAKESDSFKKLSQRAETNLSPNYKPDKRIVLKRLTREQLNALILKNGGPLSLAQLKETIEWHCTICKQDFKPNTNNIHQCSGKRK